MMGAPSARAQTATGTETYLLNPVPDYPTHYLPGRTSAAQKRPSFTLNGPATEYQIPQFAVPPASGAGVTGYDSTNILRPTGATARRPGAPTALAQAQTTSAATADNTDTKTPPRRVVKREEDPFAPLGVRVGAFTLYPAIELSAGYDSNTARVANGPGSSVTIVAPELKISSNWQRHSLSADLRGTYTAYPGYHDTPSLDRASADFKVDGRIDVLDTTRIELQGRFLLGTDNPGSPDITAGLARLPYYTTIGGTAGIVQTFNRLEIGVKGSIDSTAFQNSLLTNGTIASNADRDYRQIGGEARASYELTPGVKPFVALSFDRRIHATPVDRSGFARDSEGRSVRVGSTFELTRKLTGEASIGYTERDYKDPLLPGLRGTLFDASLTWTATALTTLKLTAKSEVNESTLAGVSGVLSRDFGIEVEHAFRRWLTGTATFGYGLDSYQGLGRVDKRYSLALALLYKLSRTAQLKAEYRRDWLRSDVPGESNDADTVLFGLRLQR